MEEKTIAQRDEKGINPFIQELRLGIGHLRGLAPATHEKISPGVIHPNVLPECIHYLLEDWYSLSCLYAFRLHKFRHFVGGDASRRASARASSTTKLG
jgi:hypothetical protein